MMTEQKYEAPTAARSGRNRLFILERLLFVCIFMLPVAGFGQNLNASISGLVLDPSGAAVPGAELTFTNVATHAVRSAATNADGHYLLAEPDVGTYNVVIEAKGFKAWRQTGLIVSVGGNITLNVKLQVGAVTQTVTVKAPAARIDTSNAEIGSVIQQSQIQSIAVNGRNYISLAALVPGSVSELPDDPYAAGFFGNSARDTVTGPGRNYFNWSLYKHFYIHERFDTELRLEFYNVFNQVNFMTVSDDFGAGNFGEVTAAHDPRILQLGLMLHF
ncbi:MAG TPA: carboxypeptidase-like regulatory domain-containing protein [Terriglobia bacterium]|nr:carboxypeptidase-like regulatory domain-containing protein [Terriglobia bacterium]